MFFYLLSRFSAYYGSLIKDNIIDKNIWPVPMKLGFVPVVEK